MTIIEKIEALPPGQITEIRGEGGVWREMPETISTVDLKALVQRLEQAEKTIYEIAKYYPTKGMVKIAPMRAVEEINQKVSVYLEERE